MFSNLQSIEPINCALVSKSGGFRATQADSTPTQDCSTAREGCHTAREGCHRAREGYVASSVHSVVLRSLMHLSSRKWEGKHGKHICLLMCILVTKTLLHDATDKFGWPARPLAGTASLQISFNKTTY